MGQLIEYYKSYTPIGDLAVILSCTIFLTLIHIAYVAKTRTFTFFKRMTVALLITAFFHMANYLLLYKRLYAGATYIPSLFLSYLNAIKNIGIYTILFLFILYMMEPLHIDLRVARGHKTLFGIIALIATIYELIAPLTRFGFSIIKEPNGTQIINKGKDIHGVVAVIFIIGLFALMTYYRKRIYRQILIGIMISSVLSAIIVTVQIAINYSATTMIAFLFPLYTLLYLIHSNPYDIEVGTLNETAFIQEINDAKNNKRKLILVEFYMHEIAKSTKTYPENLRSSLAECFSKYFQKTIWFKISGGRIIFTARFDKNIEYIHKVNQFLQEADVLFADYNIDYKSIALTTHEKISHPNDYMSIMRYIGGQIAENSYHVTIDGEIETYLKRKIILKELFEIANEGNLKDPRVLVYCQPIFNSKTGIFDTCETLMRLRVMTEDGERTLMPGEFIPLAEKNKIIYPLSLIILHKTCVQIRKLLDEGYNLQRMSVNFTISDFKHEDFCDKVCSIIESSDIPFTCIAMEITETQSESDFLIIQEKMNYLHNRGIKFYLDDFGTGYSNYERIAELPFDIIKFDRSLVIASAKSDKSKMLVTDMAGMFKEMNYAILYEGIEDTEDIARCKSMYCEYMQGFHYSKPIPIENVTEFLTKTK